MRDAAGPYALLADHPHELVVVRHGETDWNAAGRLQGREDVPLNDTGRAQARRNGRAFAARCARLGLDPDGHYDWIASPLRRAAETMRLMREAMGLDPLAFSTDDRLVELDFGRWSGLLGHEIAARDPDAWADRSTDGWNHVPPGGESSAAAVERLTPVLLALTRPTVIVTHGGVNRVLSVLLGLLAITETRGYATPQDRVSVWSGGVREWI